MASPFKALDLRSKLLLWALAILFAGIVLYTNQSKVSTEIEAIIRTPYLEQTVHELANPVETFLAADNDEDGLQNSLELLLGGDINTPDTDGDGFSDYHEFLGGYDLTSSKEEPYTVEEFDAFFTAFDKEFGDLIDVRTFYYTSRVEALVAEGREEDAEPFKGLTE